ncbi:hypothetical protein ACMU_01965 [Actibacterium mucosum KCTC 23349]|uniref:Iron-binding zinc finger CDGSH type domain-containing protein n=1 Tax=Actibacterium mucosum KCTC 23349 TaxID=1454373 RepID=A0A037ZR03_9RHOB|nr:CDGSH iron-sulfur domain-containing protein [Actibacterium mucosum]KAJ57287.1 hypothetical protein ACMU_01965 [Actibacterium mucosum KCTC 23349]
MTDRPKIVERENGPLVVTGMPDLRGTDGTPVEGKEVMALCRCGASQNKPFCDGSHNAAGFQSRGGKPEGPDRLFTYEGAEVTVGFIPRLCGHAAECGRIASNIFDVSQKPWVQPDKGTVEQVEAVVAACPSSALQIIRDGVSETIVPEGATIQIQENGPYWVTGCEVETDTTATGLSEDKYILCRCGLSGNKPYCDGSHRDKGWKSED